MKTYSRYRVYPRPWPGNVETTPDGPKELRARSFEYRERAIEYAGRCYAAGPIYDATPIHVCIGSGSDFKTVGRFTAYGWKESA